ncbi:surface-adhesin E family protein [Sandarakinorhabdus limnophila]|uniref:surface-adhesin E family protein n=1 Tax=Sandarakinorhabdus limnophila TaxID=210512 RepID=UPI003CC7DB1A
MDAADAGQSRWTKFAEADDDSAIYYVDDSRIVFISQAIVQWWEKAEYKTHPNNWDHDISLYEANCSEGKTRAISINVYFTNGEKASTANPGPWRYVVPETVMEGKFNYVCRRLSAHQSPPSASNRSL